MKRLIVLTILIPTVISGFAFAEEQIQTTPYPLQLRMRRLSELKGNTVFLQNCSSYKIGGNGYFLAFQGIRHMPFENPTIL